MTLAAMAMDRSLDVMRGDVQIDPVRPGDVNVSRHLSAIEGGLARPKLDLDHHLNEWLGLARLEADKAAVIAERYDDSPAAWTRSAFAQFTGDRPEEARTHALKAAQLVLESADHGGGMDEPALVGAITVLASLGRHDDLQELARALPGDPAFAGVRASLAAHLEDVDVALKMLDPLPDETYAGLVGYLLLRRGEPHKAISMLRRAVLLNGKDVGSHLNLALALRGLGSLRKALRSAAIAVRVAPGRVDAQSLYLDLLAAAGRWDVLEGEVKRLDRNETSPTPESLIAKARLAIRADRHGEAQFALKHAERLARESGLMQLAADLSANQAVVALVGGTISRSDARRRVRAALELAPASAVIADILASLCYRTTEANELVPFLEMHQGDSTSVAFSLRARLAYLSQDWEKWRQIVREWIGEHPADEDAMIAHLSVLGHVDNDWGAAARAARTALKAGPQSALLVNQAAFILAMAGKPGEAINALGGISHWNYRLEATLGLAYLAGGDLREGISRYRVAARMISDQKDAAEDAPLLRLYLAVALRHFGLVDPGMIEALDRAGLLRAQLPDDWEDIPAFGILRFRSAANDWPWPPTLDG